MVVTLTDPNGHPTGYQYDSLNRRTRTIYPDGSFDLVEYDLAGNVTARTGGGGTASAVRTEFLYDSLHRLRKRTAQDSGKTPVVEYRYDPAGNLVEVKTEIPTPSGAVSYVTGLTYDSLNRRVREAIPGLATKEMAYDASGNRTSLTVTAAQPAVLSSTVVQIHGIGYEYT